MCAWHTLPPPLLLSPVLYLSIPYISMYIHIYKHICVWHTLRPPPLRSRVHNALSAAAIGGPPVLYIYLDLYTHIYIYTCMYTHIYVCGIPCGICRSVPAFATPCLQ